MIGIPLRIENPNAKGQCGFCDSAFVFLVQKVTTQGVEGNIPPINKLLIVSDKGNAIIRPEKEAPVPISA
jgi:hypothetical protein